MTMFHIFPFIIPLVLVAAKPNSKSTDSKTDPYDHLMFQFNVDSPVSNSTIRKYPHEKWCDYYYNLESADEGLYTVRPCPKQQVFDYHTHECKDKASAQCWSDRYGKTELHDHIHSKWRKHFRCPFSTGKYPDVFDCEKYFLCTDGTPKHKHCPEYKEFDRILRRCVSDNVALCADVTDAEDISHRCPKSSGKFGHPKHCSKYFQCHKGQPKPRVCRKGLLFHEEKKKCIDKNEVHCDHRHNPYKKGELEKSKATRKENSNDITPILDVYDESKEPLDETNSREKDRGIELILVDSKTTTNADHTDFTNTDSFKTKTTALSEENQNITSIKTITTTLSEENKSITSIKTKTTTLPEENQSITSTKK